MEWQQWASVAFIDRKLLPASPGIYIITDEHFFVWYVGQAINLQSRWTGRAHHRYPQLIRTNRKLQHRIFWHLFLPQQLNEKEQFYIHLLRPELNGCKVKTYLPKQPQVEREIKRLFKVLNKTTMLFPVIRSAVAGEYVNAEGTRCVVTIIYTNDCLLLGKSARKRYSAEVKRAWGGFDCLCGRSDQFYKPLFVNAYEVGGERFEFVVGSDVLWHLGHHADAYRQSVGQGELFGVEVTTLHQLDVLALVEMREEYDLIGYDKKTLWDAAYLRYRKPMLAPLKSSGGNGH
ncbi:MAG: hypothetical protein DCF15_20000 [Phormidesmis priestleyi]|uniref:GIY-YIG domain-containing protein n=1 Tax=Phormidesmis priestleyi TaxID=268141 RepID=A0A2W4WU22_9CYAN|nr:MAG: hypothetical protein DCF15_20000 [Phormidesmis priestleyi]